MVGHPIVDLLYRGYPNVRLVSFSLNCDTFSSWINKYEIDSKIASHWGLFNLEAQSAEDRS